MIDLLLLTHSEDSTTGTTLEWCRSRGLTSEVHFSKTFFETGAKGEFKGLLVFGGDMEAWETEKHPWLLEEKKLIAKFIAEKKPIFGICLGSQLLAEQLGGEVKPIGFWEFGWFPVTLKEEDDLTPLQCHSSMFTLPPKAVRTASDRVDANQGFRLGNFVGYQFHTEIDQTRIDHITSGLSGTPPKGRTQTKQEILDGFKEHAENLKRWYFSEIDAWWNRALSPIHPSQD